MNLAGELAAHSLLNCIFCKIVSGKSSATTFFEDSASLVIESGSVDKLENLRWKLPLSGIIEKEDLKAVADYFAVAREIIDPVEFPILTSYSWDESGDLLSKFQSEIDARH